VHQNRVSHCPEEFLAGYYWYSGKRKGTGTPPILNQSESSTTGEKEVSETSESEEQNDKVSADEVDEEQDTEPELILDSQWTAQEITPPEVREVITHSELLQLRKPSRFT